LAKTRIELVDLREQQNALSDISASVDQALAALNVAPDVQDKLRAGLFRLLATRAEMLPRLSVQQTRLASLLADIEQQLTDLTATTAKLSAMLDERCCGRRVMRQSTSPGSCACRKTRTTSSSRSAGRAPR